MKASLKFREDQKPLCRFKVPINILGLPFQSGVVAGESKELNLNLSTFFESGPSIKFAYRPNDVANPFSLVVKTGSGSFGSPLSSSLLMSAEFNLPGSGNPNFMLHFKPKFGDFSFKKSQSSVFICKGLDGDDDSSIEVVDSPVVFSPENFFHGKKLSMLPRELPAINAISGIFSGMDVAARTMVPVTDRAAMNFRWGVRVPADAKTRGGSGLKFNNIPFLVMNKIGIEQKVGSGSDIKIPAKPEPEISGDTYLSFMRQLEILKQENVILKREMEDFRRETYNSKFPTGDFNSGKRQAATERRETKQLGGINDQLSNENQLNQNSFSG